MGLLRASYQGFISIRFEIRYALRRIFPWSRLKRVMLNIGDPMLTKSNCEAIIKGYYERGVNSILLQTLSKDDRLMELGTGLGFNAISGALINGGKVITFDGNPSLAPLVKRHSERNGVAIALRNQLVVSKQSASAVEFNIAEEFWSSSRKSNIDSKIVKTVSVETVPIAEVFSEFKPTYLLVDIEGGEADLFENCDFLKNSSVRKILLELHPDITGHDKCFQIMDQIVKAGYELRIDTFSKFSPYFEMKIR